MHIHLAKNEIGIIISFFRKECGLKQVFMAYKLGISTHAYANIERGRSDINSEKLDVISKLFGVKPYQIIVLAEEIRHNCTIDGLLDAVKGIIRLTKINLETEELTQIDEYLLSMDKSVRRSALEP